MGARWHTAGWVSRVVSILNRVAEESGAREGLGTEIVAHGEPGALRKRRYSLAAMMVRVTPHNIHPELATGPSVGNEAW